MSAKSLHSKHVAGQPAGVTREWYGLSAGARSANGNSHVARRSRQDSRRLPREARRCHWHPQLCWSLQDTTIFTRWLDVNRFQWYSKAVLLRMDVEGSWDGHQAQGLRGLASLDPERRASSTLCVEGVAGGLKPKRAQSERRKRIQILAPQRPRRAERPLQLAVMGAATSRAPPGHPPADCQRPDLFWPRGLRGIAKTARPGTAGVSAFAQSR